ncbi:cytochrome P450 [Sulfitobacter sp. D35]|uniref:cytochrome P450 n=1 Tax=Sulfitobacter sp. D35 TaxID=3083252 RepID=UPI00296FB626|nr:cytochrome P450 [Sulfitobacter sp. D35]MDW4496385.1 cytochrome P450 [Sulfitobacter sp. D35]
MTLPPKPSGRAGDVPLWRYARLFRADILSAQPDRLYRAWMAEFRTPFFRSYLVNQPDLVRQITVDRPDDFPKSDRVAEGLRPLLGRSVFLSNGAEWARQRRIIDPAFARGRIAAAVPAIAAAAEAAVDRLRGRAGEVVEIEAEASHAAADVIFRTLFSVPIEDRAARAVFDGFRAYQRAQPVLTLAALVPLPRWWPRRPQRAVRAAACDLRGRIAALVSERVDRIADGTAPDDLATRIMTTPDTETGRCFSPDEMVDQVAIFFLAGHETSAAALAWALYLLAENPDWQEKVAHEAADRRDAGEDPMAAGPISRDVFRETLRLYPPVPMMVREASRDADWRGRRVLRGAQVVLSPWHLQRHERLWSHPDAFDPGRWRTQDGQHSARTAYMPFGSGPRVCPGAGFAMIEGPLILSRLVNAFRLEPVAGDRPVPVAHLTVRARDGIRLRLVCR